MWTDARLVEMNKIRHAELLADAEHRRQLKLLRQAHQPAWKQTWQQVRTAFDLALNPFKDATGKNADSRRSGSPLTLNKVEAAE